MTVRPMRPADEAAVSALQELLAYADPELPSAALDGPYVGRVAVEPPGAADGSRGRGVADDPDGDVIGYAIALPGREATLSELAVAPGSRREGVGRTLVDAIAYAAGAERLFVATPVDNEDALTFYESLGFDVDGRVDGFYADGSAALRLVRRE